MRYNIHFPEGSYFTAHLDGNTGSIIYEYVKISFQPQKGKFLRLYIFGDQGTRLEGNSDGISILSVFAYPKNAIFRETNNSSANFLSPDAI